MIKLFSNIRRKLIHDGQTSRYLKYAIGEIILVVIGILIALQVNNWNQKKIQENTVKSMFLDVQEDLLNDIEEVSMLIENYEKYDTIAKNVVEGKYTKEDYLNPENRYLYQLDLGSIGTITLSKQSYIALNAKKDLIDKDYQFIIRKLNRLYIELGETALEYQNTLTSQSMDYQKYVYDHYDWILDVDSGNYTEEAIEYHLTDMNHKRQIARWNRNLNLTLYVYTLLKSEAVLDYMVIHQTFTPNEPLPKILSKYGFELNNKKDYMGNYVLDSDSTLVENMSVSIKYGLLFWNDVNSKTDIFTEGYIMYENGKDSLGFVVSDLYKLKAERNQKGEVIGFQSYTSGKKTYHYSKQP